MTDTPEARTVLGHTFRPFDKCDWDMFGGADAGSLICHLEHLILILDPIGTITEVGEDGSEVTWTPGYLGVSS